MPEMTNADVQEAARRGIEILRTINDLPERGAVLSDHGQALRALRGVAVMALLGAQASGTAHTDDAHANALMVLIDTAFIAGYLAYRDTNE